MAADIEMDVFKNHQESSRESLSTEPISLSSSTDTCVAVVVVPPSKPPRKYGLMIPDEAVEQLIRDQQAADLLPSRSNVTKATLKRVMVGIMMDWWNDDGI